MNMSKTPERLLGRDFMTQTSPYQIYKHVIEREVAMHWHDFFELAYIVSGAGVHIVNGESFPIQRGMAFLLTTADVHELMAEEGQPIRLYNMIFEDSYIRQELMELLFERERLHLHSFEGCKADEIEAEFRKIWEEAQQHQAGSDLLVQGSVERILILLSREVKRGRIDGKDSISSTLPPAIRKSLVYIDHHFREQVTLEQVSSHIGLSANYFSECFRKGTGISFQEHLISKRLTFAKALIGGTDLLITEICHASGFNTISHFERMFKARYGQSPSAFRKTATFGKR